MLQCSQQDGSVVESVTRNPPGWATLQLLLFLRAGRQSWPERCLGGGALGEVWGPGRKRQEAIQEDASAMWKSFQLTKTLATNIACFLFILVTMDFNSLQSRLCLAASHRLLPAWRGPMGQRHSCISALTPCSQGRPSPCHTARCAAHTYCRGHACEAPDRRPLTLHLGKWKGHPAAWA